MGQDPFSTLWFSGVLLGASVLALWQGGRIAWRGELDNPLLALRGRRAVAFGLAIAAVGALGVAVAVAEGMKLRL